MKKSLFAVAMAVILLATNCQKTEIMNPSGTSIGFDSQIGKLTKAEDAEGLETLKTYGFRVWAYRNFEDEYYSGADAITNPKGMNAIYDGMGALEVGWSTERGWYTGKDYYWPGAEKELKFFAVSCDEEDFSLAPTASTDDIDPVTPDPEKSTISVKNFKVLDDANNDLMVANVITQAQGDATNGNTVKPVFGHTLTKVQFNFRTEKSTMTAHPVYVLSIQTSALQNQGTLTLPFTSTTEGASPWSGITGSCHYKDDNKVVITLPNKKIENGEEISEIPIDVDGEPDVEPLDRSGLTLDETLKPLDTWLLLPQDIYDETNHTGATVTITYIIKDRWFQKTFPLFAEDLKEWKHNQFVKYNVTIAPNLISFNPTVEQWDTTDAVMNDNGTSLAPNTPAVSQN